MPPKAKFTREQISRAALDIIREQGIENVTARELGKKLGSSACPIFTVFENMAQVIEMAKQAARDLYGEYIKAGLGETPAFKGVGTQYIRFAMEEPKLFQLLFMSERQDRPDVLHILPEIDENYPAILRSVESSYGVYGKLAEKLYRHLWIYTHGIAVLCATNMCAFTAEEIGIMMAEVRQGLLETLQGE